MNNMLLGIAMLFILFGCTLFFYFRMYRHDAGVIATRLTLPLSDGLLLMIRTTEAIILLAIAISLVVLAVLLFLLFV